MKIFVPVLHAHFHCSVDIHILYGWHQKEIALKEDCILHKVIHTENCRFYMPAISHLLLGFLVYIVIYNRSRYLFFIQQTS